MIRNSAKTSIIRFICTVMAAVLFLPCSGTGAFAEEETATKPSAPVFSVPGGFYDDPITLSMTSPEGNSIFYTLDCNDPAKTDYSFEYSFPFEIANTDHYVNGISSKREVTLEEWYYPPYEPVPKATVVRAVCIDEAGNVSDETVQTYFIHRTEDYYSTMNTISLVTEGSNLFGAVNGIYVVGEHFEEWRNSDDYEEYDNIADPRYPTNYNQRGREWERPCRIQVFSGGESVLEQNVGMRVSGNYSRCGAQKSVTLYARKEYGKGKMDYNFFGGKCVDMNGEPIEKYDRVTLRNGGNDYAGVRFRDDLNQELMSGLNLSVQTKTPYILYINGEFWGMYSMQEKLDDHYLASHYGVDEDNVTIIKKGKLDKGSEEIMQEYCDFYEWALEADFSDEENYRRFEETVDIDGLIDLFVAESYICNWDFAPNVNNWMMWRVNEPDGTPYGDGKWRFMVYDTEYSLGLYGQFETGYYYDYLGNMDVDNTDLALPVLVFYLSLCSEDFTSRFSERYRELVDTVFAKERVLPMIDRYVEQQREAYEDTQKRFSIWGDYRNEVFVIKTFFEERAPYAIEQMEAFCGE